MPWVHCGESISDTNTTCPACGVSKAAWTVELEVTRSFTVRRRKLLRVKVVTFSDDPMPGEPLEVSPPEGEAIEDSTSETGLTKVHTPGGGQCRVRLPERSADEVREVRKDSDEDRDEGAGAEGAQGGGPAEFSAPTGGTLRLQLSGPAAGELKNARWSHLEARVGEEVELAVDAGFADGDEVVFRIREVDAGGEDDPVTELRGSVRDQVARASWTFAWDEDEDDEEGSVGPEYVFEASREGATAESRLLRFKDWVELELFDRAGEPCVGVEVTLNAADGSTHVATTDAEGLARWDEVPAGDVSFDYELPADDPPAEEDDPDEPQAHPDEGEQPLGG